MKKIFEPVFYYSEYMEAMCVDTKLLDEIMYKWIADSVPERQADVDWAVDQLCAAARQMGIEYSEHNQKWFKVPKHYTPEN